MLALRRRIPTAIAALGARRMAGDALWVIAGSVMLRLGPLVAAVATGRLLGDAGLGGFTLVLSTASVAATLFGTGLGAAATRFVAEHRDARPAAAGRILGSLLALAVALAVGIAAAGWLLADVLATRVFEAPALEGAVRTVMPLLACTLVHAVVAGALAGLAEFRVTAIANAAGCLALVVAVVPAARAAGVVGAAGALVLQAVVALAISGYGLRRAARARGVPLTVGPRAPEVGPAVRFAIPSVLSLVMYTPATWYGSVLLARSAGGLQEVGLFGAAQQWFAAIAFIPTALSPLVLSALARGSGPGRAHRRVLWLSLAANGLVAGSIGLAAVVLAEPILALYGAGFTAAAPALRLLAVAAFFGALLVAVGQYIAARASMWWGFALNALWAIVFLLLALRLAPRHGALGLAGAYLGSYACHLLSCSVYLLAHRGRRASPVPPAVAVGATR